MPSSTSIHQVIADILTNNQVVLFMKGTATMPQCGFSSTVARILQGLNVEFLDINVLASDEMRQGIKAFSDWPTIPQLYINKEFIGGCDIVKDMYASGELQQILTSTRAIS
jgi:monothiol glutaredoxin